MNEQADASRGRGGRAVKLSLEMMIVFFGLVCGLAGYGVSYDIRLNGPLAVGTWELPALFVVIYLMGFAVALAVISMVKTEAER